MAFPNEIILDRLHIKEKEEIRARSNSNVRRAILDKLTSSIPLRVYGRTTNERKEHIGASVSSVGKKQSNQGEHHHVLTLNINLFLAFHSLVLEQIEKEERHLEKMIDE
jgi:hypothetical protein